MNINRITWESVRVTCAQAPSKDRVYYAATVTYRDDSVRSLEVQETEGDWPASASYAGPKLLELTPDSARFSAFWWASDMEVPDVDTPRSSVGHRHMIPIEVECHF